MSAQREASEVVVIQKASPLRVNFFSKRSSIVPVSTATREQHNWRTLRRLTSSWLRLLVSKGRNVEIFCRFCECPIVSEKHLLASGSAFHDRLSVDVFRPYSTHTSSRLPKTDLQVSNRRKFQSKIINLWPRRSPWSTQKSTKTTVNVFIVCSPFGVSKLVKNS